MVIDFNMPYMIPRHLDRLFDEFFKPSPYGGKRVSYPLLNLSEDQENVYVRAEIPGLEMADLELTLTEKSLVIKGERKAPEGAFIRQERPAGGFQRIINLNLPIDRDAVKATLADGLLSVVLPKAEDVQPRKIAIDTE